MDGIRVYVGELSPNCSERELEHIFKKYGPLVEVWMANVPPCFAFVVFRDKEDAEEAIRDMNGRYKLPQLSDVSFLFCFFTDALPNITKILII